MPLTLQRLPNDRLCLSGLDAGWQMALAAVPALLAGEQPPAVRERLLPKPTNNETLNREWRELVTPELEALWKSNHELMAADLARLEPDPDEKGSARAVFPANHAAAWISAINQARLTLGTRWNVTEEDMNRPLKKLTHSERDQDIFLIHLFAFVEELFIENDETWPGR